MSHTPGFEDRILDHMFAETPAQIRSLAAELKLILPKRVFEPGTTPAYSNFGVMLAGEAVSHLEGASFQDVIERGIITPLGMGHTTFREPYPPRADLPAPMPPALAADVSTAYHWRGIQLEVEPTEWITRRARRRRLVYGRRHDPLHAHDVGRRRTGWHTDLQPGHGVGFSHAVPLRYRAAGKSITAFCRHSFLAASWGMGMTAIRCGSVQNLLRFPRLASESSSRRIPTRAATQQTSRS